MDIRSKAVESSSWLHLRDSSDELLYETKRGEVDGEPADVPDLDRPVRVHLHSPGSKSFSRAQAAKQNRMMEKLRKKGKISDSAEQQIEESSQFLTECTIEWENMSYDQLQGAHMSKAVYSDSSIGFIPEQVSKHLGEWGNFTRTAPKPS